MVTLTMTQQIINLLIIPLLTVLTGFLVNLLQKKTEEIVSTMEDKKATKYINMLSRTIQQCVIATNQTYVESLKNKGEFTKEAQLDAFDKTFEAVKQILSEEAKQYLEEAYGDLDKYITEQIESTVNQQKK